MAAETQMKRDRRLADARITAERDAELARAEYDAVRAERRAAEQAVRALGGDLDENVGMLVLRSPIAGKLVSAKVARGQTVEPSDTLFEVADLSTVWVELQIFERDLASMQVGDTVEITTQAAPPQVVKGQVSQVGDMLDPETRSAPVRVVVENDRRLLRPGQSVHARIQTRAPTARFLGIPRAAVTRVDGKATVFVLMAKGAVEPRPIKMGPEDATDVAVLEGLRAGEQVIVGGVFELKSELFR
jgi:cobalt-zinc-cadmium efflux system membrane fusion protein